VLFDRCNVGGAVIVMYVCEGVSVSASLCERAGSCTKPLYLCCVALRRRGTLVSILTPSYRPLDPLHSVSRPDSAGEDGGPRGPPAGVIAAPATQRPAVGVY